jgi:hypothetical protein
MRTRLSSKRNTLIAVAIAGVGLLSAASPAFAEAIGGYAGKVWPHASANESCMNETNGGVINQCGEQTQYEIPLSSNAGTSTVSITVINPGGGTFQCYVYTVDANNSLSQFGPVSPPGTGLQHLGISATVQSQGTRYVFCNLPNNGQIVSVIY